MTPVQGEDQPGLPVREGEIRLATVFVAAMDATVGGEPKGVPDVVAIDHRPRRGVHDVDSQINLVLEEQAGEGHAKRWLALGQNADVDSSIQWRAFMGTPGRWLGVG